MDFILRYRGPLSGDKKNTTEEKQAIRVALDPQLRELCRRETMMEEARSLELLRPGSVVSSRLQPARNEAGNLDGLFWRVPVGGADFVPLITRPHELACAMDILWLRREKAGAIVHGGDLDNRLKNLLDGLRMPLHPNEAPPATTGPRPCFYCLLEDDALITKLNVTTHQLLLPVEDGQEQHDVDLILHVVVQSTYPMIANLGF